MRKLIVALMVGSLVLAGIGLATAADLPQALKGVDLSVAKKVTDTEAQNVRGAADQLQIKLQLRDGSCSTISTILTCVPVGDGPFKYGGKH